MTLNFHDFDWLLEKDKPHGLKPLDGEDLARYAADPEAEQKVMDQHSKIHGFDTWIGKKQANIKTAADAGEWQQIKHVEVGVRQA